MTAELVARLGAVDYRGDRPCVPQDGMAQLAIAIERPRRKLIYTIVNHLRKKHEQNKTQRAS